MDLEAVHAEVLMKKAPANTAFLRPGSGSGGIGAAALYLHPGLVARAVGVIPLSCTGHHPRLRGALAGKIVLAGNQFQCGPPSSPVGGVSIAQSALAEGLQQPTQAAEFHGFASV